MTSSNPFWFEDLVFSLMDECRRLPERASNAAAKLHGYAETGVAAYRKLKEAAVRRPAAPVKAEAAAIEARPQIVEAEQLDDPLTWALATEPLATSAKGVERAVALHETAGEQLGAISYVLDRMREDLAPALMNASAGRKIATEPDELDVSIQALLELSRRNAATRPSDRFLSAA